MSQRKGFVYILYAFIGASCLLATCLLLLISTSEPVLATDSAVQPDAPGSISGHVKDRKGEPIEGINVALFTDRSYDFSVTDKAGFYRFPILAPNEYRVVFSPPYNANSFLTQYYSGSATLEGATKILVAGNQFEDIDAILMGASEITGTISFVGISISEKNYIQVFAYKFDEQSSTWSNVANFYTANSYNYVVGGLTAGTYRVCALVASKQSSSSLAACHEDTSDLTNAQDVAVDAEEIVTGINIVFRDNPDFATISGHIVDISGNPISGVAVSAYPTFYFDPSLGNSSTTTTNQNGDYTIDTLTPNTISYTVYFSDANGNYRPEYYDNVDRPDLAKTFRPQVRQVISNVNAVLDYAGHISGTITLQGGAPFVSGSVNLFHKVGDEWQVYAYSTIDPTSGHYHFSGLLAGTYRICASFYPNNQWVGSCYGAKAVANATDIRLTKGQVRGDVNFDIRTQSYDGRISGQVNTNGAPLAGIRVDLINSSDYIVSCDGTPTDQDLLRSVQSHLVPASSNVSSVHTTTDAQGSYKFEGLSRGYYLLKASDPQFQFGTSFYNETSDVLAVSGIDLDCGEVRQGVNISMTVAGAVSGRITIASGMPLSNTAIHLISSVYTSPFAEQTTLSDEKGNYLIRGVQPATYWLWAYSTAYIYPDGYYVSEYYGASNSINGAPQPITVTSGLTTTGIDIILGPDGIIWLPQVRMNN